VPEPDRVPRLARPLVVGLIALMVASAAFVWEPWPFTSFRLFSHLRYDEQVAWHAKAVGPGGEEIDYPIGSAGRGFRGFGFTMAEFVDADSARRDQLCQTWVAAAPDLIDVDAGEVRLYPRRWRLSERSGDRALRGTDDLGFVCTQEGARDAG
jgi:hypothetical protein